MAGSVSFLSIDRIWDLGIWLFGLLMRLRAWLFEMLHAHSRIEHRLDFQK